MSGSSTTSLNSRAWVALGAIVCAVVLAAAWLLVISPIRSEAGELRSDAQSIQTQNVAIVAKTAALQRQAEHRSDLVAELTTALKGLPPGPALPTLSRQLAAQAAARGVTVTSVSVGAPSGADGTAVAGTAENATGPLSVPVTVQAEGPAQSDLLFMYDVARIGPRLALVTSSSLAPLTGSGATDGSTGAGSTNTSIEDAAQLTLQITVFTNPLPKATRTELATATSSTS